ncbi:MAG TPA: hypothetical protein VE134_03890, partial [Methanomicrobiales archaeon]|nr:hypothetical protein [Methanomicrobiales archaeon]
MSLKMDLQGIVPPALLKGVPDSFSVIGDIAILSLPEDVGAYGEAIGERIISRRHSIRTVLNKATKLNGEERIATYQVLAGGGTITIYREFGYRYCLDVAGVFFNPRLAYERQRVARKVCSGEDVLVPFCGVGPFAIPIAGRGAAVVALEKQEVACRYLRENARMNHLQSDISIIQGDASLLPLSHKC